MRQHLRRPWWTSRNGFIFFREFAEICVNEVCLRKVRIFRKYLPRKDLPFPGLIRRKSKFLADYTAKRQIILGQGRRQQGRIIRWKSKSPNLTFYRPITTVKANFRRKFNHGWSVLHCKTDESHVPHKFTKMQSGPMTNVISPNRINSRVL